MITVQEFFKKTKEHSDCDDRMVTMFLDHVVELLAPHSDIFEVGSSFIRVQKGGDVIEDCYISEHEKATCIKPYSQSRLIPKIPECGAGRFHVQGESTFYFSAKIETAVKEMRPCRGMEFSVARFVSKVPLKLVVIPEPERTSWMRLTLKQALGGTLSKEERDQFILSELYCHCSWPVPDKDDVEYGPTQRLAQCLRGKGYDGIIYASSMEDDSGKISGALFCPTNEDPQFYFPKKIELKECVMKKVGKLELFFDENYDDDPTVLSG